MIPHLSHLQSFECEFCQLGKHVGATFQIKDNSQFDPLPLILFIQMFGVLVLLVIRGYRYFVSCIDDFSRCTWIFLMKNHPKMFVFSF